MSRMRACRTAGIVAVMLGAGTASAFAGSEVNTVLDLCAKTVTDARRTGAAFEALGWAVLAPDEYAETAAAFADADLATNAYANATGADFERARTKWRTMRLNSLKVADGEYSWTEAYRAPHQGIVLVSMNAQPDPDTVTCQFVSPEASDIAALRSAILNGNAPQTNGVAEIVVAEGRTSNAAGRPGTLRLHMMTLDGTSLEDALGDALLTSAALTVTFTPD